MAPEKETQTTITYSPGDSGWQEARERNRKLYPNSYGLTPPIQVRWITSGRKTPIIVGGKVVDHTITNQPPYIAHRLLRSTKRSKLKPDSRRDARLRKQQADELKREERMLAVLAKRKQRAISSANRKEREAASAGGAQ